MKKLLKNNFHASHRVLTVEEIVLNSIKQVLLSRTSSSPSVTLGARARFVRSRFFLYSFEPSDIKIGLNLENENQHD